MTIRVELRGAKIPYLGLIAIHYWFVVKFNSTSERWEIWQNQNRGQICWGHLHLNLMSVTQGVGNGDSWLETFWEEDDGSQLKTIIHQSPDNYPYNYLYRYYPGPNSNTYVQWILNQAKIDHSLSWRGWGKNYR